MDFKKEYKVWTWKNLYMLHWIINPVLIFNELVLGQRGPKIVLIKRNSNQSLAEKSFIPCPHCGTIHSALWMPQNKTAFGNWFGLYCNHCGKIIPCVRNITSFIFLVITFPVWIWFKKNWEKRWLIKQKEKFSKPLKLTPPEYIVWIQGLKIAVYYYIFTMVFKYIILQEVFTWKKPIGNLVVSIIIGLTTACLIKEISFKKKPLNHSILEPESQ